MMQRTGFCLALAWALVGCAQLTEPGSGAPPAAEEEAPARPSAAAPAAPPPPAPPPTAAPELQVGTSHVLIQYKGALRAQPTTTRSKDEAKKLATDVLAKAKKGQDFAALAKQYSDDPTSKERGGALPKVGRNVDFGKPYMDAAFATKPGELSSVVETDFGFHVIKRTD